MRKNRLWRRSWYLEGEKIITTTTTKERKNVIKYIFLFLTLIFILLISYKQGAVINWVFVAAVVIIMTNFQIPWRNWINYNSFLQQKQELHLMSMFLFYVFSVIFLLYRTTLSTTKTCNILIVLFNLLCCQIVNFITLFTHLIEYHNFQALNVQPKKNCARRKTATWKAAEQK